MNSWWNLHVFFPPSPSARTASTGPGHLSRISAERLQPFGGLRTQVTGSRPPNSAAWWGMKKPTGWIWMGDTLRAMIWYVSTYDIYIYIQIWYTYIQIWNGSYLYMSSCHVDNAMVITTTVNHVNNQAAWTASGRFTWLNHVQPTFLMIDAFKEY